MIRISVYFFTFTAACTSQRREELPPEIAGSATPVPAESTTVVASYEGYSVAANSVQAIADCVGKRACGPASLERLRTTPLLALGPRGGNPDSPKCSTSTAELVQSGLCGVLAEQDVAVLRRAASSVEECLKAIPTNGAGCVQELRKSLAWVGSGSCSKEHPGELQNAHHEPNAGVFVEGKPWAVQFSGVTVAAWSLCLEGADTRVTGLTVAAQPAAE